MGPTPGEPIEDLTRVVSAKLNHPIGIHTHNDGELAVANTLAGVRGGAVHIQGTINGYGERCGNANMVSVMANLALKTDLSLRPAGGGDISHLTSLSRSVAEIANVTPLDYQPFVGRSAFAHKGGVHGAAVAKVERSYQHIDPVLVGNQSRLVVSELGGRANTRIRRDHELYLMADRTLPYGYVVEVMAAVQRAGVTNLGMITNPVQARAERAEAEAKETTAP